jgi:uncharacterized protein with GYD domain
MPTYVTLMSFSQEGLERIKEGPSRLDRAKEAIKAAGGELKAFYLTLGHYDAMAITDAPSDEAYATTILSITSAGTIRTVTLRAFTEEEYRKIVASLP